MKTKMISPTALILNGPNQWYDNLSLKYKEYGRTWLQQNGPLNPIYESQFNESIKHNGYFIALGYVQNPVKKVHYLLHIDLIYSDNKIRLSAPDETTPEFDNTYDVKQGKCKNSKDYKYVLWLRVIHFERIEPINTRDFISSKTGRPLVIAQAPHFYVNIPTKLIQQIVKKYDLGKTKNHNKKVSKELAIQRMAKTAIDTVTNSNGQQVLRSVKNKESCFKSRKAMEKYISEILKAQDGHCAITGLDLQYDDQVDDQELLCSLDRIDSDGHYEIGNLQVVCRFVNRWKNDGNDSEFRRLIDLVRNA